ncbi:MAG: glycosyltransferase [Clostridia bacterium]|nr:glycosyltransferase [Clostridia bacterium]
MPEISIVIPVYNTEKYLLECIESILSQTFKDFEIILVDDGSTDGSGKICDDLARKHSFARVLHQKNMGQSTARNNGVYESESDLICFIDSDDIAHPDLLSFLYAGYLKSGAGVVTCERISGNRLPEDFFLPVSQDAERIDINEDSLLKLLRDSSTVYWTLFPCLIRKSIYQKYPLEPGRIMEDNAVTCKWLVESGSVEVLHAPLYFYRDNPNGTMNSPFSVKKLDFLWALEEQLSFYKYCGFDRMLGAVAREYILTSLWFAKRAESELEDKKLSRELIHGAVQKKREYSDHLILSPEEEKKLFKAAHPFVFRLKKHFG